LEVSGVELPSAVRDRIVERWGDAIFDGFLERDATLIIREHLYNGGWLQAKVAAAMTRDAAGDGKTLRIEVEPGAMLTPRLQFEGNALVATPRLQAVAQASGSSTAWLDPAGFTLVIDRVYREEGLLSAEIAVLPPETRDAASIVRVVIREGEPWRIGRIAVEGADRLPDREAAETLDLPAGSRYEPRVVAARVDAVEQRFRAAGFLDARVTAETVLNQRDHTADVRVRAAPGRRSVLSSVAIDGAPAASPLIARSVNFVVGMPVDSTAISDARRNLYDTGVYRRVDINLEPVDVAPADADAGADRQVVARVHVEERPRYAFRYGLQVLDDVVGVDERSQQVGFSADLENRNLLGLGATVGVSARLRPDQQIGRVFVGANRFFGLPLRSNLFVSRERQQIGSDPDFQTLADITEISAEQTYRLRRFIDLRYGYGYGRNRTTSAALDFDLTVKVARLTTTVLVDRRSDPFDPARGWFAATTLEVSRPGLGSDLSFLKSYLQYFRFFPLGDTVLLASAARVGLARTYRDEDLIPNERFFAGGATSVRGYGQDDLGPRSIFADASGGRALFIGNGELRFPLHRWLKGVGFVDVGNVYETVSAFSLLNLQTGTGVGLRLHTPVGLLRFDVAVPVNRRPFDPKWTTYFGLGHAF
jgi:outer membrane protein assembly complex protein YaeT